jgi:hypothetical protein
MEQIGVSLFSICWGLVLCLISIAVLLPIGIFSIIKHKYKILLISAVIILVACIGIFFITETRLINGMYYGPPAPILEPNEGDVVGSWQLSEDSINYLQSLGYTVKSHELVFQSDGTFKAANIPYLSEPLNSSQQGMNSSLLGEWELGRDVNGRWAVILSSINYVPTTVAFLNFEQSQRPYTLRLWISEWGGLVFERK